MPRSTFLILLLALACRPVAAADDFVATIRGYTTIQLDKSAYGATQVIEGTISFEITDARGAGNKPLTAVRLIGPRIDVIFPDDMLAAPVEMKLRTTLLTTFKVGHRYELPFSVRLRDDVKKLLKGDEDMAVFHQGTHKVNVMVDSPRPLKPSADRSTSLPEAYGRFTGAAKPVEIRPAGAAKPANRELVKRLIAAAPDPALKKLLIDFYARRRILTRDDLLAEINAAGGRVRADLAAVHVSLDYPSSDLAFFQPVGASIALKGHPPAPLFLLARPQQRVRFDFDLSEVHRLRVADLDTVVAARRQVDFDAPKAEGIYEIFDETHDKAWGWLLVRAGQEAGSSTALRPDTRELSAKVLDALIKQDAKALAALGVPGLRAEDEVKKARFKLGRGDVRYHQSTGTTTKVTTQMRINIAAEGKPPIFSGELQLDFVRVGEELKLSNVQVIEPR